jgi:signal transduction histidine kinase
LPLILGDESRLIQVMENLIGNAIRHTSSGGQIVLSAKLQQASQPEKMPAFAFP